MPILSRPPVASFSLARIPRLLLIALFLFPVTSAAQQTSQPVTVAAAADLKFAFADLSRDFQQQTHYTLRVTYGSSGNFFAQITNGAPFDVFLSADVAYPEKLIQAHAAVPGSLVRYARGALVLWIAPGVPVDPSKDGYGVLLSPSVRKVAIANPHHAPYGRAAEASLKKAGLYAKISPKLVMGENIAQTAQFVEYGNAQAGIIALSLVRSGRPVAGKLWDIPMDSYPPINQAAVLLLHGQSSPAARAFLHYLSTPSARTIFQRYGFKLPAAEDN